MEPKQHRHPTFDQIPLDSRVLLTAATAHAACSFRAFLLLPRLSVDWRGGRCGRVATRSLLSYIPFFSTLKVHSQIS